MSSGGGSSGGGELSPVAAPTSSFDIFLSYAWGTKDAATQAYPLQQKAHAIHRALCAAGYSVWLDTERMPHSATTADAGLDAAMCSGISGSSVVVICFSASYATSVNCRAEASYAKRRRKPTLFVNVGEPPSAENPRGYDADAYDDDDAAVVASVAWLSMHISDSLWADCRSQDRMPSGMAQLLTSLSGMSKLRKPSSSSGGGAWGSSGGGGGASSGGASALPAPTPASMPTQAPAPTPSTALLRLGTIPWSDVTLLPSPEAPALLGQGAFGRVYRGRWGGLSVAVKEILPDALPPSALAAYDTNEALLDCSTAPSPLQTLIRRFIREAEVMRESQGHFRADLSSPRVAFSHHYLTHTRTRALLPRHQSSRNRPTQPPQGGARVPPRAGRGRRARGRSSCRRRRSSSSSHWLPPLCLSFSHPLPCCNGV